MQIICNHCGNQLSFPDYQNLVTCNFCATHLQIEETENYYTASIIQEKAFDKLLNENQYLIQSENTATLFNKNNLENEYSEALKENTFRSFLSGEKLRPMLFRGIYRMIVALICGYIGYRNLPNEFVLTINFLSILFFSYATFIGIVGFREIRKWIQLWRFEREYKIDTQILTNEIDILIERGNLNDALHRWYKRWLDSEAELDKIKTEFHYQKLGFHLPTGPPSVSKGLRTLVLVLPALATAFTAGFEGFNIIMGISILFMITFLIIGFSIMGDANNYQNSYKSYLEEREKQLKWLNDYFEQ